jgi:glycosyltransferase involved in cell wall biosynthesis
VVYQFRQPIEETANRTAANESNSWLARSFRVAEHFVLTRAAAVVVNNQARREACVAHGVPPQQVFCIPQPLPSELFESVADRNWLTEIAETGSNTLVFAIPSFSASELWQARDAMQRCMRLLSVLLQSCREMKFIILAGPGLSKDLEQLAAACKLTPFMKVVDEKWQSRVIQSADVVICDAVHGRPWEPTDGLQTKMLPALQALARGRALLAADIPEHREISSDGRGCLWFRAADIEDIAHRALFLIQHPRFRQALAAAGRQHCLATRSGEAVAAQYDVVYRLAFSRRKDIDGTSPAPQLIPLEAAS